MALPASDTFLQSTGSTQGLATYSSNWTVRRGSFNVHSGTGDVRAATDGSTSLAYWNADTWNADHWSAVEYTAAMISGGQYGGPACRIQAGADTAYHLDCNGGSAFLQRMNAGTDTTLATPSISLAAGDWLRMTVTGTGATVTILIEKALAASPTTWSTVTSVDDTSGSRITAAGASGINGYSNWTFTGGIGAWSGDNVGGGGPDPGGGLLVPVATYYYRKRRSA